MKPKDYFRDKELTCKCGCGAMPRRSSVERLYAARIIYGKPVIITSAARCPGHNMIEGGKVDSTHITDLDTGKAGQAFDTRVPMEDDFIWVKICMSVGFTGIGFKDNDFTHVDDLHEAKKMWGY